MKTGDTILGRGIVTESWEEGCEVSATYSGGEGTPYYQPSFTCSCGFFVREQTWEDAGYEYDQHLKEMDQ